MAEKKSSIHILPGDRTITALPGAVLRDVLIESGYTLDDYCGGQGKCGKCRVRFLENAPAPSSPDENFFRNHELAQGYRLACQTRIEKNASLFIPEDSLLKESPVLLNENLAGIPPASELRKITLNLTPASLENQISDLDLLRNSLNEKDLVPDLFFLRKLPQVLRSSGYSISLTIFDNQLMDVEPAQPHSQATGVYGVSFDLGTTTVAGALYQLDTGQCLGRTGRLNPQTIFGADVVSRILYASQSPENRLEMRLKIGQCLNEILAQLCYQADISKQYVGYITLAGNTTMQHLFLGVPADNLPLAPYVPVYKNGLFLMAEEAGLYAHPRARLYVFPAIGGFVGGDTVADLLVADLSSQNSLCLMIDIGTNGEIVLGNRNKIFATSTAAGPAFEGRNISCGMRAEKGAIDRVTMGADLALHTIEDAPASGLCGTGLISLVSELLSHGLIDPSGRFQVPESDSLSHNLKNRLIETEQGRKFLISSESQGAVRDLYLLQKDLRELQLAKGAIAAGTILLLKEYGATINDIETIYLAGAFGNYIDPSAAIRLGLLPDIGVGKIRFIGNAALTGASYALVQKEKRLNAEHLAREALFIELAGRRDFQDVFAETLLFPDH